MNLVRYCFDLNDYLFVVVFFSFIFSDKQNGVLSSTEPSLRQSSKASRAFEEAETPINQRTLTKATTPPVTIKNFFKPKTVERSPESNKSASEHQDVKEKSGENDCMQ